MEVPDDQSINQKSTVRGVLAERLKKFCLIHGQGCMVMRLAGPAFITSNRDMVFAIADGAGVWAKAPLPLVGRG